jgi:thiamine-phosphate pyrophosphorylase
VSDSRLCGIYAIVDPAAHADAHGFLDAILRGGIRLVQLRDKRSVHHRDVLDLHARCAHYGATLIVNDDVDASLHADGVHLGEDDLHGRTIAQVRSAIGSRILGLSAATPAQARAAYTAGVDYIGAGPFRATVTKADAGEPIGPEGLRAVAEAAPLPVAAIGGITPDDVATVVACGARMAAVISALASAPDPFARAREFVDAWNATL